MDDDDRGLGAMPKLVGGPKYSRPPVGIPTSERPLGPDDLPLEAERTPEEHALAADIGLAPAPVTATAALVSGTSSFAAPGAEMAAPAAEPPNGAWTVTDGAAGSTGSRSRRRSVGSLFRTRSGGSGDAG